MVCTHILDRRRTCLLILICSQRGDLLEDAAGRGPGGGREVPDHERGLRVEGHLVDGPHGRPLQVLRVADLGQSENASFYNDLESRKHCEIHATLWGNFYLFISLCRNFQTRLVCFTLPCKHVDQLSVRPEDGVVPRVLGHVVDAGRRRLDDLLGADAVHSS